MINNKNFGTKFNKCVVSVASWEDRFLEGSKKLLAVITPDLFVMSYCSEYAELSKRNRDNIEIFCQENNIKFIDTPLSFKDPVASWLSTKKLLFSTLSEGQKVTIDISTMPRETIWTTLAFLEVLKCKISYIYCKPLQYNKDWLSQEPDNPRIVFKLGGVSKLGSPTVLVILSGYDTDRINQLINFFDPELTLIGFQAGSQMDNQEKNVKKCQSKFGKLNNVKLFELDAYSPDHGYEKIHEQISPYIEDNNIVLSSLGPKLSAIALYRLHKTYPDVALAYAPSKRFNPEYSYGLGESFVGDFN